MQYDVQYPSQYSQQVQSPYYGNNYFNNDPLSQQFQYQQQYQPQQQPLFQSYMPQQIPQQQQPQSIFKQQQQQQFSGAQFNQKASINTGPKETKFFIPKTQRAQSSKRVFKFEDLEPEQQQTEIKSPNEECGILRAQLTNFVANGQKTPHTKWPWHAQIVIDGNNADESETFCGGTLISKSFVLTAAHCYDDLLASKRAKNTQILLNGVVVPSQMRRTKSKTLKFRALNVFIHPDYVPAMSDRDAEERNILPGPRNDLALVEINVNDEAIKSLLMPVCLPAAGYQLKTNTKCKIMGHGFMTDKDEDSFIMPTDLQMADVLISSNSACRNEVDSESIKAKINSDTICIRGPIHPCVGDSGGPLLCQGTARTQINGEQANDYDEETVKKWFLTGVTSFAVSTDENDKCGQFKSAVFGKVAHNIDWINRITIK